MSTTQSEKDVVRDGRVDTLGEEAEAPLRDQIVQRLYDRISDSDVNLGIKLSTAWETATTAIQSVLDKQQTFLADLDSFKTDGVGSQPFGGTSNIHIPVAFIVCKSYHARFLEALMGIDPPFSMKARREDGSSRIDSNESLMRYALMSWSNGYKGVEGSVDSWLWNWITTGTGIIRPRWHRSWERFEDVEEAYIPATPVATVGAQGETILTDQWRKVEKEVVKTVKTFDGPWCDLVDLEDFRMIGGEGDVDQADILMYRTYMTASELWTKVDEKIFKEDVVSKLVEGGKDDPLFDSGSGIKQQRKMNVGEDTYTNENHLDRYEVIEAILKYDATGSGITSDIVVVFERRTGEILSATYLRRILPSGERPYAVIHFHKRPKENYGLGLLEILNPLTSELDTMHNIRIDNALFQSQPFYIYKNTASFDAESVIIEPGVGIGVDNMNDIQFPVFPNRTGFTASEEAAVQNYIERLTGISDLSLGVQSSTQGAARTASGVRALLGENNNNLSVHLRRLNQGWTKYLKVTWHMLQNRVEPGFAFRITGEEGEDKWVTMNDIDLAMDADFELSANTSNSNKAIQIELSQQLVAITTNPLMIQLGLCGPEEIYAAQKSYLNNLGLKDVHRYLKRPQGYAYKMSPEEEFMRVIKGSAVPVDPAMDHAAFIAFTQTILDLQNEPGARTLNEQQVSLAVDQMQAHEQMMQALQQQQAQQAQAMQMQTNMALSPGAPPGFSNQTQTDPGQLFL